MGDVVAIDAKPHRRTLNLVPEEAPEELPEVNSDEVQSQEEAAISPFINDIKAGNVENFVIFIHRKDGTIGAMPYLSQGLSIWDFVSAFKFKADEALSHELVGEPLPTPTRA